MGITVREAIAFHDQYLAEHRTYAASSLHQPGKEEIVSAVFQRIDPGNVRVVSLYGSRADGRNEESSDVDVVVLLDTAEEEQHIVFYADALRYSLMAVPRQIYFSDKQTKYSSLFYGMKPLYDPFGEGARIAEMAERYVVSYNRSRSRPNNAYREVMLSYLRSAEGNDTAAALAKNQLLFLSLAFLAEYNGYMNLGRKKILDMLLRDSPETAEGFALTLLPGSDFENLRDWVTAAFSEPLPVNFESLDFSASVRSFEKRISAPDGRSYSLKELYSPILRYRDYISEFCEYFHIPDVNQEKLLSELQTKAPYIYDYLWALIV